MRHAAALALVFLTACPAETPAEIPLDDLPAAMAQAECDWAEACYGPAAFQFSGKGSCVQEFTKLYEDAYLSVLKQRIEAGTVVYHPEAMATCLSAPATAGCQGDASAAPACDAAFEGKVAEGDHCTLDAECEGSDWCDGNDCRDVCTARVPLGGECDFVRSRCEDGSYCDIATGKCSAPLGEGEACSASTAECGAGLYCDENGTHTCVAQETVGEGETCDLQSPSPWCAPGLTCEVADLSTNAWVCAAPSQSGGPCTFAIPNPCPDGEYCALTGSDTGICTALPGPGEACVDGGVVPRLSLDCAPGSTCDWGVSTCVALARLGEACTNDHFCYSGSCEGGVCVAPTGCPP